MSFQVTIPAVGESISEVTISNWVKKTGDVVKVNDVLCEIESDKATFELAAEANGVLEIVVSEGETIAIGTLIAKISETAPSPAPTPKLAEAPAVANAVSNPTPSGQVVEMRVPTVGESISEVTVANWVKQNGDFVNLNEILCELESDKATFELPADASGVLEIVAKQGDVVEIGGLICKITTNGSNQTATTPANGSVVSSSATTTETTAFASPAAAKILAEKGITPNDIKGSGKDGRITKEDALKAEKTVPTSTPTPTVTTQTFASTEEKAALSVSPSRASEAKKMSSLRKTIARRLVAVKNETAMLTTFNEVNMSPIMEVRKKYKDAFKEKHEVNLGFMSFFTKAAATALMEFKEVNAYIEGENIIYNNFVDISIAVSTERGLVVPVIRDAHLMNFAQIEKEIIRLAIRARDGKLTIPEMTGGTFTITNGGIFGSMLSTPIINSPQSAILGMHNIVERPVVINGEIKIAPIMYLALSYDHRIIDGKDSVSFLVRVKQLLEDPTRMLLEV